MSGAIANTTRRITIFAGAALMFIASVIVAIAPGVHAQTVQGVNDFSLQVTPSPIVETLKPGTDTAIDMVIRNQGPHVESLKIEPRKFTVDNANGDVKLSDTEVPEFAQWISYSAQTFVVQPGAAFQERIHVKLPKDVGFSYSFALLISRTQTPQQQTTSGRVIKGSVAVFMLVNVDRPGAVRKLEIENISMSANIYEYLPATVNMRFKNTGNTIVQPYGNVFIRNGSGDGGQLLATLPVNNKRGYILPGSDRLLKTDWADGFPVYQITTSDDGNQQKKETWDFSQIAHLRIGPYNAKLIAVYNDGQRDVPLQQDVAFWVIPWKIILGVLVVVLLLAFAVFTIIKQIIGKIRKRRQSKKAKASKTATDDEA